MNNCGKAYILCSRIPAKDTSYDLGINTYREDDNGYACNSCGAHIHENSLYWVEDEAYCERCAEDSACCHRCGNYFWTDHLVYIKGEDYCFGCISRSSYHCCIDCGENFFDDDMLQTSGDKYICTGCVEHCTICEGNYKSDDLTDGKCEECQKKLEEQDEVLAVDKEST